VTAAEGQLPGT